MPEDPTGELKQTNKGRAGLFVQSHGRNSCSQAQSKLAGVVIVQLWQHSSQPGLCKPWEKQNKYLGVQPALTPGCLSSLLGRVQSVPRCISTGSSDQSCSDKWSHSPIAAEVTKGLMGLLYSVPAFFLLVVTNSVTEEAL